MRKFLTVLTIGMAHSIPMSNANRQTHGNSNFPNGEVVNQLGVRQHTRMV
jgi:hypothetical protein